MRDARDYGAGRVRGVAERKPRRSVRARAGLDDLRTPPAGAALRCEGAAGRAQRACSVGRAGEGFSSPIGFTDALRREGQSRPRALLAWLCVEYADGEKAVIGTDESWLCRESAIRKSEIYDGETFDATFVPPAPVPAQALDYPYHEYFENLDEYKQKDNFKRVLNQLSLDDVKMAIQRSGQLMIRNQEKGFLRYQYKTYSYYAENPSLSIWESIKKIMTECGIL